MKFFTSTLTLCLLASLGFAQSPLVQEMTPNRQTMASEPGAPIVISFDQALNPATVNSDSFMVFGRWSGPMDGTLSLNASNTEVTFTPQRNFFYGEWITVRLTKAIENDNGDALDNGYAYNYWIKTLPGTLNQTLVDQFSVREAGETFIQCYGAYAGDVNNDESTDLVVVNENSDDIRVFLNDGEGGYDDFTSFAMPNGNKPSTNEGSDFDHDGMIDVAIGNIQNDNVSVFMGNDANLFNSEVVYDADLGIRGIAVIDVNGDGWDDLATANRTSSTYSILINDGTGNFNAPITTDSSINGETSIAAIDLNNDGIQDLAIGGFNSSNVLTLLNDGQGNFTETDVVSISGSPWMLTAGDMDNDGNVDIVSVNSSSGEVSILLGDGTGHLTVSNEYAVGNFSLAIDVGDIDGDEDLDFIASNFGTADFTLYENIGGGNFANPITYDAVQAGSCAILHDRNNDGALDITLVDELEDVVILYENEAILDVADVRPDDLTFFPNPFTDTLFIKGLSSGTATKITIYDLQGRIVFTTQFTASGISSIDLSSVDLAEGSYIIEIDFIGQRKKKRRKIIRKKRK
ncbi:MAG: VCBS repeat-containing protein [Flavobacteriaceae bacterium]|nr:VCBS repeat-containing protein [Flavobacteriaceae bacterium]